MYPLEFLWSEVWKCSILYIFLVYLIIAIVCLKPLMLIKQYKSTILVGTQAIVVHAAQKAVFKKTSYVINHIYRIILVRLASNIVFSTRKHFQVAGYWIFKKSPKSKFHLHHSLTHSLTHSHSLTHTHSLTHYLTEYRYKARDQTKQCMTTIL